MFSYSLLKKSYLNYITNLLKRDLKTYYHPLSLAITQLLIKYQVWLSDSIVISAFIASSHFEEFWEDLASFKDAGFSESKKLKCVE